MNTNSIFVYGSVLVSFLIGGVQAISSSIGPTYVTALLAVLGAAAFYFHNAAVKSSVS